MTSARLQILHGKLPIEQKQCFFNCLTFTINVPRDIYVEKLASFIKVQEIID